MFAVTARRSAFAGTLLLLAASPVLAQGDEEMAEYRRNCTGDYSRLCSAYDPGSDAVKQCFMARRAELSPRCAATIAKYEQPAQPQRRR